MPHHTPPGGVREDTAPGESTGHGPADGQWSIGAVVETLREEFPEVTASTVRFLEAEGLVEPVRSATGGRFRAEDVTRLRHVLRMQRDHCLPLAAIRRHLEAAGEDGTPPAGVPGPVRRTEEPEAPPPAPVVRMGRGQLLRAVGAQESELAEWEEYGLLGAAEDGSYGPTAITVARLVVELGRHGLEARHLRALKAGADRQRDLVERLVAPVRQHPDARTRELADSTARDLADLSARLYQAFVGASPGTLGD
ncbi:transcriptional regulator FtsR [Streptomyces albus]|uniref:transcriptional regulator FtsR n=1 Tax=Streptomyces albus TaxID=1888 RepID=UPI0037ACC87B